MATKAHRISVLGARPCNRRTDRNIEIMGEIEHPKLEPQRSVLSDEAAPIGICGWIEWYDRSLDSVVPPHRHRIPFNQLEQTLECRLLNARARSNTVAAS